jgi:histidyl-tRNA synthetase
MKFQAVKGTRDFYPEDMAVRNWIFERWHRVARRSGFVEVDGPIFEYLDLYRVKSGEGIVSELFHFEDRGGRALAIRPEMTPTLARMVAARAPSLTRPIKWYSVPRLCRAERPQRGRLREFFQWNVDIIGEKGPLADAECIYVAVDFFRECGLKPEHVVVKINSRAVMADVLRHAGFAPEQFDALYAALDRRERVPAEVFEESLGALGATRAQKEIVLALGTQNGPAGLQKVTALLTGDDAAQVHLAQVGECFALLDKLGVGEYCRFDTGVVRGLAYYTGLVFEGYGMGGLQRAICGGGRYDQLISTVGGPPLPAVGFATSDVVIQDLLVEFGLLPEFQDKVDLFVIDAAPEQFERVLSLVDILRRANYSAVFAYRRQPLGRQLKAAAARGARRVVIVDPLTAPGEQVILKDMESGRQAVVTVDSLMADPFATI